MNSFQNKILFLLSLATLYLPFTVQAQNGKVGFVDVEIVIEQSRAIRMGMDALDRELSAIARDIDSKERSFRQKRFEMDRQERVLSAAQREERRQELATLQEETEQLQFDLDQQIRIRQRQIEPVLELIMNRVADVAEKEGFDMVLRGEVVIYGSKTVDLTEKVILEIDSNISEVLTLFKEEQVNDPQPSNSVVELPAESTSESAPDKNETEELVPLIP